MQFVSSDVLVFFLTWKHFPSKVIKYLCIIKELNNTIYFVLLMTSLIHLDVILCK